MVSSPAFARDVSKTTCSFKRHVDHRANYGLGDLAALAATLGASSACRSARLIGADAMIVLKYARVFGADSQKALAALPGPVWIALRNDMAHRRATSRIASPHRVTGYQVDAEINFRQRLCRSRIVRVFAGADRMFESEGELDVLHAGHPRGAPGRAETDHSRPDAHPRQDVGTGLRRGLGMTRLRQYRQPERPIVVPP